MVKALFCHIPKAAGTSLRLILEQQYFGTVEQCAEGWRKNKQQLKWLHKQPFVTGHVPPSLIDFLGTNRLLLTMLRDPVRRAASNYWFHRSRPNDAVGRAAKKHNIFDFVARTPYGRVLQNRAVRILSTTLLQLPDGTFNYIEYPEEQALDYAKLWVDSCDWVGIVEDMPASLASLAQVFGVDQFTDLQTNQTDLDYEITPEVETFLIEHNQLDIELYTYVIERLGFKCQKILNN